jgi:4-amino-4-deoxy-L-arabinose transferase-like glycosyltransferase
MSRKRRRAKSEAVKVRDEKVVLRSRRSWAVIFALVLAGIPFAVGKYIEFNSPGAFDSGAYVYSAKHILEGARIGIEEKTSAQPGTLLVNVIGVWLFGFSEFGPKLIQGLLQAGALVFMFWTMRRLFGAVAAVVGVTVAAVYLSAPVISKFGNVKEQYMIAFMILGACCFVLGQMEGKWWWKVLTGAAIINAFYFKPTGVSVIIAVIVFLLLGILLHRQKFVGFLQEMMLMLGGGIAGLVPLFVLYSFGGGLKGLLKTLPVLCLNLALIFGVVSATVWAAVFAVKKYEVSRQLKTVRPGVWKAGCVLLVLAVLLVVAAGVFVKYRLNADKDDAISYVKDIAFIKYPLRLYVKVKLMWQGVTRRVFSGYVVSSWEQVDWTQHRQKVFRYYRVLALPICLAIGSLVLGLLRYVLKLSNKIRELELRDGLLVFLGVWWFLDMAFVWISPRSYEQYYLPLNASGAFLGGYLIWMYSQKHKKSVSKHWWKALGAVGVVCMVLMSQNIFLGQKKSPDTGMDYRNSRTGEFERRRGFAQRLNEISARRKNNFKYPWEQVGEYIGQNSGTDDKIYVWGWYPGIYVKAQRLSSASKAFESDMHVKSPARLSLEVNGLIREFEQQPPKFIVDSRKVHFPNDRPPLELWPITRKGLLPKDEKTVSAFDAMYARMLREEIPANELKRYQELTVWIPYEPWKKAMPEEAKRYEAMKPFRDFVMRNYEVVPKQFGMHVLFRLKDEAAVGRAQGG